MNVLAWLNAMLIPLITPAVDVGVADAVSSAGLLATKLLDKDNIGGMFANIEKISYRKNF